MPCEVELSLSHVIVIAIVVLIVLLRYEGILSFVRDGHRHVTEGITARQLGEQPVFASSLWAIVDAGRENVFFSRSLSISFLFFPFSLSFLFFFFLFLFLFLYHSIR